MSKRLNELLAWFPSGTAEGEKPILDKVFVYVDEFANILSPPKGSPYLLIGNKGSGKSAIIDFAHHLLDYQKVPAVKLTPVDIDSQQLGDVASTGDLTRAFYRVLLISIATKLSEQSTGWFSGDRAALYSEAVEAGGRSPDFAGRMGKFLAAAAKPLTKVDTNAAFPHLGTSNPSKTRCLYPRPAGTICSRRFGKLIPSIEIF